MIDAAILVGGKGTRLGKITKKIPKPLIILDKKPFLDYLLAKISRYNFRNIYLLCSYKKNLFFNKYNNKIINNSKIICIDEGKCKGTGGSLYKLKKRITNKFLLINGDTYFDIDINDFIKTKINQYYACIGITKFKKYKYNKKIVNLKINKKKIVSFSKTKTGLMNGGIYLLDKKIFKYIKNKKISLENDVFNKIISKKKVIGKFYNNNFIDIGTKNKLAYIKKNTNILKSKAFFLDRDGVINKEVGYLLSYKKFKFLSGVKKGIKYLNKKNFLVIVITNQSPVGRSILKETELKKIHSKMKKDIFMFSGGIIDDIFYSPYYRYSKIKKYRKNYIDRKPNNGMLNKAIDKWCIDVNKSKFMGDQITDKKCSEKSKIKFYFKKNINFYDQIKKII